MTDNKISQLIPLTITSLITSLLTKEMLTPLVLLGRTYNGRSMPVQAGLIIVFAILYFLVFWKVLQPLFARIPALRLNQQFFFVMILLLTVSIMSKELFIPGMIEGYDIDYHMLRIESLSAGIKQGQFPVRVNPVFLNGFGYASSLFYPDLLLYFPAALRALGLSTILSAKLFLMTIFTLCFLSASWAVRRMTGSSFAGLISAVVYCLSQYLLQNVYRRGAMGEVQAFIFLPLIVYGLYSLVFERFEKHWVMAIGFIGLLYSHLISALIGAIVVSAISLFHLRKILTDKVRMLRIIKFSMITLGITIAFWLPLIEQLSTGSFKFSQSTYMARSSAVPISAIFAVTGRFSGNHVVFGLPTLILCLLWFVFQKNQYKPESHQIAKWGLGIGAVLLFIVTDFFPWHWMNGPLNIIQFPWRLYSFAVIFLAVSIGVMLDALIQENWRRVSLIALVAFLGIPAIWVINVSGGAPRDLPDDFYRQTETTFRINNGEWLPASTKIEALMDADAAVVNEKGEEVAFTRTGQQFQIRPVPECETLDLPILYYTGYSAAYVNSKGTETPLSIHPVMPDYTVRVACPTTKDDGGAIHVAYSGTLVQKASLAANLVFAGAIAIIYRYKHEWLL